MAFVQSRPQSTARRALLGVDVGWSEHRRSTGVAYLGSSLIVDHCHSQWDSVHAVIGPDAWPTVSALDAPLLAEGVADDMLRPCEQLFSRSPFQRRCKPAMSHVRGTGLQLRRKGAELTGALREITGQESSVPGFPRLLETNIVEAFPNTFLGVAVEEAAYQRLGPLRRGQKFDRLYDLWCEAGRFAAMAAALELPECVVRSCEMNQHHDERAALVCLVTAAAAATGHYVAVGEQSGGYFFLPAWEWWCSWARDGLAELRPRSPTVEVWISGRRYASADALPPKRPLVKSAVNKR